MLIINLPDLAATALLGRVLAGIYQSRPDLAGPLFLQGNLGSGKTTLARHLVEALPGGSLAEVSSPSFTLCNEYDTAPPVLHYDLYRLDEGMQEDSLLDALEEAENTPLLVLLEWPERLGNEFLPSYYLHCRLTETENNRRASFTGYGIKAAELLQLIAAKAAESGLDTCGSDAG